MNRNSVPSYQDDVFDSTDLPVILPKDETDTTDTTTSLQPEESEHLSAFHSLQGTLCTGEHLPFSELRGKYVLIVNIASQCGKAYHLKGLEEMYERYPEVEVLGFPSNDFLQERKTLERAVQCYQTKWDVRFKIMQKCRVNGKAAHPVYKFLKREARGLFGLRAVTWNFEKFLIDPEGNVIRRYWTYGHPVKQIMRDLEVLVKEYRDEKAKEELITVKDHVNFIEGRRVVYV